MWGTTGAEIKNPSADEELPKELCLKPAVGQNTDQHAWPTARNFAFLLLHLHLSLDREVRWGTTDDFTTSVLHFSLFSTALWDLASSRPVHSLVLSSHLFLCLPCLLRPFIVPCIMVSPDLRNGKHAHSTCFSNFRLSGSFHIIFLSPLHTHSAVHLEL